MKEVDRVSRASRAATQRCSSAVDPSPVPSSSRPLASAGARAVRDGGAVLLGQPGEPVRSSTPDWRARFALRVVLLLRARHAASSRNPRTGPAVPPTRWGGSPFAQLRRERRGPRTSGPVRPAVARMWPMTTDRTDSSGPTRNRRARSGIPALRSKGTAASRTSRSWTASPPHSSTGRGTRTVAASRIRWHGPAHLGEHGPQALVVPDHVGERVP